MNAPAYASFLIRMWRETSPDTLPDMPACRAQVEQIQTGQKWGFDDLNDLLAFLRRRWEEIESPGWRPPV
jgi:hypothetical protein